MTIQQILKEVSRKKPMARPTLYTHLNALKVQPIGCTQRPQRYPDDTAARVLTRLGFSPQKTNGQTPHHKRKKVRQP